MKELFTIGYEGVAFDDFLRTLREASADVLLDIRETPYSRRREFCKNALAEALGRTGIEYRHEQRLGTPKTIRDKIRRDGDSRSFKRDFNRHLQKHHALLQELSQSLNGNIALFCYEKDHRHCHRDLVAAALSEITGLAPRHLLVKPANNQQELF